MFTRTFKYAAVLCLLSISSCSLPRYSTIRSFTKPAYDVGKTPSIGITEAKGSRRNYQDATIEQLIAQSRSQGHFVINNRIAEGIRFDIKNGAVDTKTAMKSNEFFLRFELLDSDVQNKTVERPTGLLQSQVQKIDVVEFKIGIAFTLAGKKLLMEQKEIDGIATYAKDKQPQDKSVMYEDAIKDAVKKFLTLITPKSVEYYARLDDSEPALEHAVTEASKGNFASAFTMFERFHQTQPTSAAAVYNMAVMKDALHEYKEAIALYEKAEKLGAKPFYGESKASCMTRQTQNE